MDVAGDFTVVWESLQDRSTTSANSSSTTTSYGIYAQNYVRSSMVGKALSYTGLNGEYGTEFAVNTTKNGDQRYPSIAMDDAGDCVVVWSGNGKDATTGKTDSAGVFLQRFDQPTDTAGPRVVETFAYDASSTGRPVEVKNNDNLTVIATDASTDITKIVIAFSENLCTATDATDPLWANSVLNLNNWTLWRDGTVVSGAIKLIKFAYNNVDDKYEATITLSTALGSDSHIYNLQALDEIQDVFGNALDGNADGLPGGNFSLTFTINVAPGTVISTTPPNPVWTDPARAYHEHHRYPGEQSGAGQPGQPGGGQR